MATTLGVMRTEHHPLHKQRRHLGSKLREDRIDADYARLSLGCERIE